MIEPMNLELFCLAVGVIAGFLGGLYYASHNDDDSHDNNIENNG